MKHGVLSFSGYDSEESQNVKYFVANTSRHVQAPLKGTHDAKVSDKNPKSLAQTNQAVNELACKAWCEILKYQPLPRLVISVTGGAKKFKMSERHLETFKRGLVKAATTTDTWIVTGGTMDGVMKVVGDAVKDYMLEDGAYEQALVVVGIATLGVIAHADDLLRCSVSPEEAPFCYDYHNPQNLPEGKGNVSLDPHHTHFLLADDGSRNQFGREINLRAAFEQHRHAKNDSNRCNNSRGVPVVLLLLEGGINTLQTACEAIEAGTPVVVMQDSGRAADFVVLAQNYVKSGDLDALRLKAEGWLGGEDVGRGMHYVTTLLRPQNSDLLSIFVQGEDTSGDQLAEVILKAILRASLHSTDSKLTEESAVSFLDLALSFNRCDIAEKEIKQHGAVFSPATLTSFFFSSVSLDKLHFPAMFIEMGVDVGACLTLDTLTRLYLEAMQNAKPGSCEEVFRSYILTTQRLNEKIKKSQNGLMYGVNKLLKLLTDYQLTNLYTGYSAHDQLKHPERDLFLFCLLLNRSSIAKTFWKLCHDPIGSALTACRLLRSLSKLCSKRFERFELARVLEEEASCYEEEARSILHQCSLINSEASRLLIVRSLACWGEVSVLEMVEEGSMMVFADHDVCQGQLNVIWYGGLKSHTPMWMIFLGLFCPFAMVLAMEFRAKETSNKVISGSFEAKAPQRFSSFSSTSTFIAPSTPPSPSKSLDDTLSYNSTPPLSEPPPYHSSFSYTPSATTMPPFNDSSNNESLCTKLHLFFTAPIVKFSYYSLSYVCFLLLFSFFLLADFHPDRITWSEVVVYVWEMSYWLDEFRQLLLQNTSSLSMKVRKHFSDRWNIFQQMVSLPLIFTILLRLSLPPSLSYIPHSILSLVLSHCILKLLRFFYVQVYVGPKVVMIQEMLSDLFFFLLIFAVFLLAYGVTAHCFLYPSAPPSWHILFKVLYGPYFTIFGEFNMDELLGKVDNCVNDTTLYLQDPFQYPLCPSFSTITILLFCAYVIVTCVMLLNILIAIFSYTFTKIEESALRTWQFHRISLVREFSQASSLPPPFHLISLIFLLCRGVYRRCKKCVKKEKEKTRDGDDFRVKFCVEETKRRVALERRGMKEHLATLASAQNETFSNFQEIENRTELILAEIRNLKESLKEKNFS